MQLYNLSADIAEEQNVQAEHPEVVTRLTELMEQYVNTGRSTPGEPQENTVPVHYRDAGEKAHQPKGKPGKKK